MSKKTLGALIFCVVVCLSGSLLYGQATGSFSGTVSDNSGAVIAGAKVTVIAEATNAIRDAKTDDTGHYVVPLLSVGNYTVRVENGGFKASEARGIRLQIDEQRELNFTLQPASVSTSVEVNATEVAVETANPTLGQVITSEEVADLPLNGRNFVQLATLTPGTTQSTSPVSFFTNGPSSEAATRGAFSLSVGGSREQSTDWLLDGNDNNQLDEGGIGIFSSIDDIQEFKVLTYNYSAEFGERAGPTVLVTTKSGSNQFHGTVFEFFRNTKLDATRYFFNSPQKFNLNQFGASLGGPIKKDKTFFFLDYQAKIQREGVPFTGFVPTKPMVTPDANGNYNESTNPFGIQLNNPYTPKVFNSVGLLVPVPFQCVIATGLPETPVPAGNPNAGSQPVVPGVTQDCNIIPGSLINPIGIEVAQLYPQPNVQNNPAFNYATQPTRKLNGGTWDVRVDHNFSNKDSVFGRFSYDQATNFVPGGSPTWAEWTAFGSNQHIENHGRNAVVSETHIFSSNTINQFTGGYNRIFNHILSYGEFGPQRCEGAALGIPGSDLNSVCAGYPINASYPTDLNQATNDCISCGMPSFQMSSYFSIGDRGYSPYQGGTNVYSAGDTLDLIRGKHEIRFGGVYRANEMNIRNNAFQDGYIVNFGTVSGDPIGDLLLGSMGVFAAHDQTFLGGTVGRRYKLVRPFVQDDWRVSSRLTVNLGVAWALVTPETEIRNRQASYNIANLTWYVPKGSPGLTGCTNCITTDGRVGIQFDKTAVEPRIGFAWKPTASDNTVIRGGYAIYHDSSWDQGGQGLWQNPPYYAEVDPFTGCCGLSNGFLLPVGTPSSTTVNGGLGAIYTSPVNPSAYTGSIQAMNPNFKQGSVQQFNINLEHQLPLNLVVTAGYAGSRSHHILVSQLNENLSPPSACGVIPGYTLGCNFPSFPYAANQPNGGFFQNVFTNNSVGAAQYDSMIIKAETKSVRHGLYALLGYTLSKNDDSGLTDGLGTNPGALYYPLPGTAKLDWGLSQLDLTHSFTASVLYDLPFGKGKAYGSTWNGATNAILGNWSVNLIERITSGFPLFVVDSSDSSGIFFDYNGLTVQRPNEVGDPNKPGQVAGNPSCNAPARIHTIQNWFNPCAFETAPTTVGVPLLLRPSSLVRSALRHARR